MVVCKICGGSCDRGEMVNEICLECAEEERQREIRADTVRKLLDGPCFQTEMQLESGGM